MPAALEVLLIEDNEGDVRLTTLAARDSGRPCRVSVANDGILGLDFLYRRGAFADSPRPHLILLDLNLPRLDGRAFLHLVKSDEALRGIPVVMLTSSSAPADIHDCFDLQANGYVVKPFEGQEFVDAIHRIVAMYGLLADTQG